MTMHDRSIREEIEALIEGAQQDQIARLLSDIYRVDRGPRPTHPTPERLQ